jgi:signal transduction histidine kinase
MINTANFESGKSGPRLPELQPAVLVLNRMVHRIQGSARNRPSTVRADAIRLAREQEREHLAREFHDVMGGELTAARLQLACLRSRLAGHSADVEQRLDHLDSTLRAAAAIKRRIVDGLQPPSLDALDLAGSLDALAHEFVDGSDIRLTTDLDAVEADKATKLAIYRLVQESLTNTVKYAAASEVAVVLRDRDRDVSVVVRDNGRGFDAAPGGPRGHGLDGMRHRIESVGGRLSVGTAPGQGTRIAATVPKHPVTVQ